jgi:hypothetical protein
MRGKKNQPLRFYLSLSVYLSDEKRVRAANERTKNLFVAATPTNCVVSDANEASEEGRE